MPWWEILVALRPPGTSKSSAEFLAGGKQTEAQSKWRIVQEILGARLKVGFVISAHVLLASTQSVQFSCSVMSDLLQPHGLQHARPPCPSLTPGFYSNSCPLSWWCHPTISVTWSQLIPRGTQDDQSPWWCRRTIKEIERIQSLSTVSHLQKHDPATKAASQWSQSLRSPENRPTAGLLLFQKFLSSWVHLENLTHLKYRVWWVFTNWTSLSN